MSNTMTRNVLLMNINIFCVIISRMFEMCSWNLHFMVTFTVILWEKLLHHVSNWGIFLEKISKSSFNFNLTFKLKLSFFIKVRQMQIVIKLSMIPKTWKATFIIKHSNECFMGSALCCAQNISWESNMVFICPFLI